MPIRRTKRTGQRATNPIAIESGRQPNRTPEQGADTPSPESALREIAERQARLLATLLKNSSDAVIVHDFDGQILAWNRGAERLYGYTEAEALTMNAEVLAPQEQCSNERALWERLRQGEQTASSWETQRQTRDRRVCDVSVTVTALCETDRRVAIARIERDITQRRQMETSVRTNEERLRLALDAGEMGTWDWSLATDALTWDSRQFELFGIRQEDFHGIGAEALAKVHPDDRPRLNEAVLRTRNCGVPFREEFRVQLPDGSIRWLVGLGELLSDSGGGSLRIVGINFDITERKQADETLKRHAEILEREVAERTKALREQGERLRVILNTAADAIITIDRQGLIQSVNLATEQMFGYATEEMVGRNVTMLMPSPDWDEHAGHLARYQQTGEKHLIGAVREVQARRKDGSIFPVGLAVSEIGSLKLYTGILRDNTHRKQLEREIVEIASLEQRRIGQDLHDSVGQEITALNLLMADLTEVLQPPPSNVTAYLKRLSQGLQRIQREFRTVLRGLLPVSVETQGLMSALADLAEHVSEGKANCRFDCPEPVSVGDNLVATHLYLIVQEAVHNAVKHARCRNISISLLSDRHLVLRVQDDGNGMPVQENKGKGLGMRIMQNRAAIIGATLTIEPARPTGTVVTCVLPGRIHEREEDEEARPGSDRG